MNQKSYNNCVSSASFLVPSVPDTFLGNTKTKKVNPAKHWCFTYNNYKEEKFKELCSKFSKIEAKWIIGKEIGEQGTPHLQGYVEFPNKVRPLSIIEDKNIHWEIRKGTREDNLIYCSKEGDYYGNLKPKPKLKILEESKLKNWQKDLIKIIEKEPNDRTIHWYWETKGNTGKTTFSKYLCHKYEAVPLEGKKNDILYCAAEFESNIYIWDLERTMEDYVSYGALEKIKNGLFMCAKYESKPIIRNPPHIIVFANFKPDENALSKDRWNIVEIKEFI